MRIRLKPLDEQVVVITGASSGIGLVTARLAAKRGARVVLVARSIDGLQRVVRQIEGDGGRAIAVQADVADETAVDRAAETAVAAFGGIDTWINNAGVSVYGRVEDVPTPDLRRLMDVTFWGVVYGSRAAVRHMYRRGGALINMGGVAADHALPLQGVYSAAKHAVKGFTEALRMELEREDVPISVTLVKPGSIDTPFYQHARNYLEAEPQPTPPVYAPSVVAEALLHCATHPVRDVVVGGRGLVRSTLGERAPSPADHEPERTHVGGLRSGRTGRMGDALHEPVDQFHRGRGRYPGHVRQSSPYTSLSLGRRRQALAVLGVGLALVAGFSLLRGRPATQADEPGD